MLHEPWSPQTGARSVGGELEGSCIFAITSVQPCPCARKLIYLLFGSATDCTRIPGRKHSSLPFGCHGSQRQFARTSSNQLPSSFDAKPYAVGGVRRTLQSRCVLRRTEATSQVCSNVIHTHTNIPVTVGSVPEIEELFPSRPPPLKRTISEELPLKPSHSIPATTGGGFFTPDTGNAGNLFRGQKLDLNHHRPAAAGPRDSL